MTDEACRVPTRVRVAQFVGVEGSDSLEQLELIPEVGSHHLRPIGRDREGDPVVDEGAEGGTDRFLVRHGLREQIGGGADLEHRSCVAQQPHQNWILGGEDAVSDAIGPQVLDDLADLLAHLSHLLRPRGS